MLVLLPTRKSYRRGAYQLWAEGIEAQAGLNRLLLLSFLLVCFPARLRAPALDVELLLLLLLLLLDNEPLLIRDWQRLGVTR